jgi:phospholipase C
MSSPITNVFVLMLENRAFDHLLGFSGITGTDAVTGLPTSIHGLTGSESNSYQGVSYTVGQPAPATMPVDPGHELLDVVEQLGGEGAVYPPGGSYPPIDNSGFVADYVNSTSPGEGHATGDFGEILQCFSPGQLPVLTALASEFALCDGWFSALPGPTWPNRFFVCAASSGGLDHSPTTGEILEWESVSGFRFPHGTIFDALGELPGGWGAALYGDGDFTIVAALHGISPSSVEPYAKFYEAVNASSYPWPYTYIEPNYGDVFSGTYEGGTSQHPLDGVAGGEGLIKSVYETLRASPLWDTSLLIITYDEHGGFYDHTAPPAAVAPGDGSPATYNEYGFTFEQLGVRVPAVVVSPRIAHNVIDHRTYEHSSVPATLEAVCGLPPLTQRDASAASVTRLVTLAAPRSTPATLPSPAGASSLPPRRGLPAASPGAADGAPLTGNLPGFLHVALRYDLELSPRAAQPAILERYRSLRTRGEARRYVEEVRAKIHRFREVKHGR